MPVLIRGGAGIGKTLFLKRIEQELRREQQQGVLTIPGRQVDEARRTIQDTKGPWHGMLIDDVDLVCTVGPHDDLATFDSVRQGLWTRWNQQRQSGGRFVITAVLGAASPSLDRLVQHVPESKARADNIVGYSYFTQNFHACELDPWGPRWKTNWEAFFDREFERRLQRKPLLQIWRTAILDVTGGHPALCGPVVELLDGLCDVKDGARTLTEFEASLIAPRSARLGASESVRLDRDIRRYVEDYVARHAVRRIVSSVRRLRDSQNPLENESFDALVQIARKHPVDAKPDRTSVRRILIDEGLLYEDKTTGGFTIPGSVIRESILEAAVLRSAAPRSVTITPDLADADRGILVVRTDVGERRLELSGTPWKVLGALSSKPGETLSPAVLQRLAGLDSPGAVKNAVQRLQNKLKAYDVAYLVTNDYGKGYRLVLNQP